MSDYNLLKLDYAFLGTIRALMGDFIMALFPYGHGN